MTNSIAFRSEPLAGAALEPCIDPRADLMRTLPKLRAYAVFLSGRSERADDLVQETVARALASIGTFVVGSNMKAWLCAILRNLFYSEYRKRRYETEDTDGYFASRLECRAEQEGHIHFLDLRDAFDQLEPAHREALLLVGASGLSYDDAAVQCGCPVGTMKSRVNRARARLTTLLDGPSVGRPGPVTARSARKRPASPRRMTIAA